MFRQDFTCPALLEDIIAFYRYGAITHFSAAFLTASRSYNYATGLVRVRSPLLTESRLMSFPLGTEMFHFPRFASLDLCIQSKILIKSGFPHSEILGLTVVDTYPRLIAACHVLRRL
jgi:hypothetical protein